MNKTLAIVSYSTDTVNTYAEQVISLFSSTLSIEKYYISNDGQKDTIAADMILVPSYDAFDIIKDKVKMPCEIIFGSRTISKSGLDKVMSIPDGTEVMLLDESMEMSKQMISVLYQLGVRHINLTPASTNDREKLNDKVVIILGNSSYIPDSAKEIVNIGTSLLDIGTILEIGIRLDLEHVLSKQNIKNSYKEIVTVKKGLTEILAKTDRFERSLEILLQAFDDGVIGINSSGQIFQYNNKAERIMGLAAAEAIGNNGIALFPQIPFETVLKNNEAVKEKLKKINGYDVVVSVDPLFHSGKLQGAVAVVKRFNEEERKQHKLRVQLLGKGYKAKYEFKDIIGESEAISKCKNIAKRMANSNSSILITGESGTGKELFAQAIHNSSDRKEYQFVAVNCGALPESLLESELFGYEEGAFTGARKGGKPGLFELAHKGTLFLDEIGEMPLNLQMRLLRVLQEREVMPLGSDRIINVDIRVIAATNRSLKELVSAGKFREDLYYRLNVLPIIVPPLRTRQEDILPLVNEFKKEFGFAFELTERAKQAFINHSWKGNVREVKNYVEYIVNFGAREVVLENLPFEFENSVEFITYSDKQLLMDEFLCVSGKNIKKYTFVLEELEKGLSGTKRMGRRSLHQIAKEKGLFIGEQEIRRILINLENLSMVEIFPGKSGTVITEQGRQILKSLSNY